MAISITIILTLAGLCLSAFMIKLNRQKKVLSGANSRSDDKSAIETKLQRISCVLIGVGAVLLFSYLLFFYGSSLTGYVAIGFSLAFILIGNLSLIDASDAKKRDNKDAGPALRVGCVGTIIIAVIALTIFAIYNHSEEARKESVMQSFEPYIKDYISIVNSGFARKGTQAQPYINGKVVTISTGFYYIELDGTVGRLNSNGAVDATMFLLPEELQANSPKEVRTIILLNWRYHEVGKYTSGMSAGWYDCQVTIIDSANLTLVGSAYFRGDEPPRMRSSRSTRGFIDKPKEELVSYIVGLPRK